MTLEGAMYITLVKFSGASRKCQFFLQFSQNIDGFRQNDLQGFYNSCKSINKTLENVFLFSLFIKTIHWL